VAIADAAAEMASYGVARTGLNSIALSGGGFMNRTLTGMVAARLQAQGLTVSLHHQTPLNDGCMALGQKQSWRPRLDPQVAASHCQSKPSLPVRTAEVNDETSAE
jgi:hydrogenase maturation protein HypF